MATRVKICGLKTEATMTAALDARADLVGLVFFPRSPRHVSMADAATLSSIARGRAHVVALVVDADAELLTAIMTQVKPDILQLHGAETPDRVAAIRKIFGKPVMKAIAVAQAEDATKALAYRDVADMILFDAKPPDNATLPGGNGVAFNWHALDQLKDLPISTVLRKSLRLLKLDPRRLRTEGVS